MFIFRDYDDRLISNRMVIDRRVGQSRSRDEPWMLRAKKMDKTMEEKELTRDDDQEISLGSSIERDISKICSLSKCDLSRDLASNIDTPNIYIQEISKNRVLGQQHAISIAISRRDAILSHR